MHIHKIKIHNYRCYKDFSLTFNSQFNIIVGDNEAGKSTILEAIDLAFSGWVNGKSIRNELSENYINKEVVSEYIQCIKNGEKIIPPQVFIEIFFSTPKQDEEEEHYWALFNGNVNTDKDPHASGFMFSIAFNENLYGDEYNAIIKSADLEKFNSIPIEYYDIEWISFAGKNITPNIIPLRSSLIDSSNNSGNGNAYLNYIVKNSMDKEDINSITQAQRRLRDVFKHDEIITNINSKINTNGRLTTKEISLAVDVVSKNAWISSLVAELNDIPFSFLGKGEQSIVKTELALNKKRTLKASAILLEEPENHLSHSNLNVFLKQISEEYPDKQFIVTTHSSYVANKLGLNNLIFLNKHEEGHKTISLSDLSENTQKFFKQIAGYDTLRLLLCNKAVLCEGDSDELILQKYYLQQYKKLPIEDGIEVISVGTSFLRFLEIAEKLQCQVSVVTDNDGDIESKKKKYSAYVDEQGKNLKPNVKICMDWNIYGPANFTGSEKFGEKPFNYNTLEPELLLKNTLKELNDVLGKDYKDDYGLLVHMHANKTECALQIFNSEKGIKFPDYIVEAFI